MDYKIPKFKDIRSSVARVYKGRDKPSTAGFSDRFWFNIPNIEAYSNNKESIQKILNRAYDVAKNHWDKRLMIDVCQGNISSTIVNIENDLDKTDEYALKFLSNDYTYEV